MIVFSANTRKATATTDDAITTRSVGIPVSLVLSSEFDGLAKTLCAKNGTAAVDVVLVGDAVNAVLPPDVLLTTGQLQIGIYAADDAGNIVIPTVWALVGQVKQGAMPSGVDPLAPSPSWVAQVQNIASEAIQNSEQAIETANEAKEAAIAAQDSAQASASAAADSATAAENSADAAAGSATDASESADAAAGSASTASTKANEAAASATTASGAAATATTQAGNASASAAAAAQSASEAEASAETATTKAGEASTSATAAAGSAATATQKASEAAQSATQAAGSASSAMSSATAAGTAQTGAETAQTAAETAAQSVSASAAQIQQNAEDIIDLKSAFEESLEYVEVPIPWHVSSNYPTGWTPGYYTGQIGSQIDTSNTNNYLRAQYGITNGGVGYYPAVGEALFIGVTPPSDKCARIVEIDRTSSIVTRIVGEINSSTHPELQGVTQRIDVRDGYEYRIGIGRFSNDAPAYNTAEYVSTIKLTFIVAKADNTFAPNTSSGTQSNVDKKQFFSVTVDRPLSFGGEETNTTTDTVEAVLLLPDSYRVEGDPVPLVLMCHGASGYIQESTGTWYNLNWKAFTDTLSAAGFALFDVNVLSTSTGTDQMGYCVGSPLAVNVAKAAYDYVTKNYNVQKKILVHGTSMGGVLASAFVKAYPQICLAQSSFAGRDLTRYIHAMAKSTLADVDKFAISYGYADYAGLVADKFSHAEGLTPSLTLKKYTSGVASLPPDRETDFQAWLDYFAELESHGKEDVIGDYTAYRSVPYKSWNSWADNVECTKAEQILQKAYAAGGSAPYLCVYYDSGTHTEMSYGQINNMIPQLIAWFKRWLA